MIDTTKIQLGMTRSQIESEFGEPTDRSVTTKRRKKSDIYRYENIEITFHEDKVIYVMDIGECKTQHNWILKSYSSMLTETQIDSESIV